MNEYEEIEALRSIIKRMEDDEFPVVTTRGAYWQTDNGGYSPKQNLGPMPLDEKQAYERYMAWANLSPAS